MFRSKRDHHQGTKSKQYRIKPNYPVLDIVGFLLIYLVTYLLTNFLEQVFHEKLTGPQLVKKFPSFYGNRKFITAFTSARHLSLS